MEQVPFADVGAAEFVDNPEPRCPVVLLLDVSLSMAGEKIAALNEGLIHFHEELAADSLAMKRVELALVTFGPVNVRERFVSAERFDPPSLAPEGNTPMGAAIVEAISLLKGRKDELRKGGIDLYRPWIFMITDGAPTDNVAEATRVIAEGEAAKSFMFFAVGVEGADMEALGRLSVRAPLSLKGLMFRELFAWLSSSLSAVSHSNTGDAAPLKNPTAPDGWAVAG